MNATGKYVYNISIHLLTYLEYFWIKLYWTANKYLLWWPSVMTDIAKSSLIYTLYTDDAKKNKRKTLRETKLWSLFPALSTGRDTLAYIYVRSFLWRLFWTQFWKGTNRTWIRISYTKEIYMAVQSYRPGATQSPLRHPHVPGNTSRCKLWAVTTRIDPNRYAVITASSYSPTDTPILLTHSMVSQVVTSLKVFLLKFCS